MRRTAPTTKNVNRADIENPGLDSVGDKISSLVERLTEGWGREKFYRGRLNRHKRKS